MAIVAGVDEAGYGPLLGPLVVSMSIFDISAQEPGGYAEDSWEVLSKCIARCARGAQSRTVVADSKKIYHGRDDLHRLERTVLAFLGTSRPLPRSLDGFLKLTGADLDEGLRTLPWYAAGETLLPVASCRGEILNRASLLHEGMTQKGYSFEGFDTQPTSELKLNEDLRKFRSKAYALFRYTERLIRRLRERYPHQHVEVIVDKEGGRNYYRPYLWAAYPEDKIRTLAEGSRLSRYRLSGALGEMTISFREKAEEASMPVALASIASKYLRELFMRLFNLYWQERVSALQPTAGYFEDAKRFLSDIAGAIEAAGISREMIVREK